MLMVAGKPYINLDSILPLNSMPLNIIDAITDSYYLIKQNTWQKTTLLNGAVSNCNWHSKNAMAKDSSDYFGIEIKNKTLAPMWILDLTVDGNQSSLNLYDSLKNPIQDWKNIKFRDDLPLSWGPFLNWLTQLDCFDHIGRSSLLITRPGVAPQYHRDIGVSDEDYVPYGHRQEFIWLKLTEQKNLYILDEKRNPILVQSKSAFFNHHNWHGSHDSHPFWAFSFKIEGVFSESFRNRMNLDSQELYD
jgi:hypothetical protein